MPRQREFDPKEVLQTAVDLFWEKGYHATSVDEVIRRSGVAKYGIYGVFGTKRELFMKVLEQYAADRRNDVQAILRQPDAALPEILAVFDRVAKISAAEDYPGGCLLAKIGVELGRQDPEIRDFVKNFFKETANVLKRCLKRAVERGQLAESTDIAALATYLANEFRTLLIMASSGHTRRDLERHLEVALQPLR
jgi:TetR/AcrR family transcriptional repressor of nem operon